MYTTLKWGGLIIASSPAKRYDDYAEENTHGHMM